MRYATATAFASWSQDCFCECCVGYALRESVKIFLSKNIQELVRKTGGLLCPEYDSALRVFKGRWQWWFFARERRVARGVRLLGWRRLERERVFRRESE